MPNDSDSTFSREQTDGPSQTNLTRYDLRKHSRDARQRGHDHAKAVLLWLWSWQVTDAATVAQLRNVSRGSAARILDRLERAHFITRVPTTGIPVTPFCLTPLGAEQIRHVAEQFKFGSLEPVVYASRVNIRQVQHDLIAARIGLLWHQRWTKMDQIADLIRNTFLHRDGATFQATAFETDFTSNLLSGSWYKSVHGSDAFKVPDAVLTIHHTEQQISPINIQFECQQSFESPTMAKVAMSRYCEMLARHEVDIVVYAGTRPNVLNTYSKGFNRNLRPWTQTRKRWFEERDQPTPFEDWMADRLLVHCLPDLDRTYYMIRST